MARSLQSPPTANALTHIAGGFNTAVVAAPFSLAWANLQWLPFVVPAGGGQVLCFVADSFVTNGGTANYCTMQAVIMDGTLTTLYATGGRSVHTHTFGYTAVSLHLWANLAAGGYQLALQYMMDAGAATTVTDVLPRFDVYLLAPATAPG